LFIIGNKAQKNYCTAKQFTIKELGWPRLPLVRNGQTPFIFDCRRHLWMALNLLLFLAC